MPLINLLQATNRGINKPVEPINYLAGNLLAHFKRYIQVATLFGSLDMLVYESKLVIYFFGDMK
jgi:hypothetical protein